MVNDRRLLELDLELLRREQGASIRTILPQSQPITATSGIKVPSMDDLANRQPFEGDEIRPMTGWEKTKQLAKETVSPENISQGIITDAEALMQGLMVIPAVPIEMGRAAVSGAGVRESLIKGLGEAIRPFSTLERGVTGEENPIFAQTQLNQYKWMPQVLQEAGLPDWIAEIGGNTIELAPYFVSPGAYLNGILKGGKTAKDLVVTSTKIAEVAIEKGDYTTLQKIGGLLREARAKVSQGAGKVEAGIAESMGAIPGPAGRELEAGMARVRKPSVPEVKLPKELEPLAQEAKKYKNPEEFKALGFDAILKDLRNIERDSIVNVPLKDIKIIWKQDLQNARDVMRKGFLSKDTPPVEFIYDIKTGKYHLDDGHNRYVAAEKAGIPLKGIITKIEGNLEDLATLYKKEKGISITDIWNKAHGKAGEVKGQIKFPSDINDRIIAGQDLAKEAREQGYRIGVNPDGSIDMWHGTSKDKADAILKSGNLGEQTFLSPNKKMSEYYAKIKGKGGESVRIKVDARDIEYSTGTGEVFAPGGLKRDIDGIWKSSERIKPAATTPEIGILRQAETIKTPETGIIRMTPGNEAENALLAVQEAKLGRKATLEEKLAYLEQQRTAGAGGKIPPVEKPPVPTPEPGPEYHKIRQSNINLKQLGLSPEHEKIFAEKMGIREIPVDTWEATQARIDLMTPQEINRIIMSKGKIVDKTAMRALDQTIKTNMDLVDQLTPLLETPATRAKAMKEISILEDKMIRSWGKVSETLTETARTLNLAKMMAKRTYNPEYWTYFAKKTAEGRTLSDEVILKIRELAVGKKSDELAYTIAQIQKGLGDDFVLNSSLEQIRNAIKAELKSGRNLDSLGKVIAEEKGLPISDRMAFLDELKTRKQIVKRETNETLKRILAQESESRKVTDIYDQARKAANRDLTLGEKELLADAVKKGDHETVGMVIQSLRPKSLVTQILGIPRTMKSTLDQSMPLRQGLFLIGKPKEFIRAFREMWGGALSEDVYIAKNAAIRSRASYGQMRKAGVKFTDIINIPEEEFISTLPQKIPGFGRAVKFSSRGASSFLNTLRADVFDSIYYSFRDSGGIVDEHFLKSLGDYVNNASGRGTLGGLNGSVRDLSSVLFSARLQASRINLLNPYFYYKLHPYVRKEALRTGLLSLGMGLTVLELANVAGAGVEINPFSSDFAKIRIGNTRYDIFGGFQQYIVLLARVGRDGWEKTFGRENRKTPNTIDLLERFARSKVAPHIGYASGFFSGKDFVGHKFQPGAEAINLFIPMIAEDAYDIYMGKGAEYLPMVVPGFFGTGIQTYSRGRGSSIGKEIITRGKNLFRQSALTPTILDIPSEIGYNRRWTGKKIKPDISAWDKGMPEHLRYYPSLRETAGGRASIETTRALAKQGIEISPADIEYGYQQLVGGAGRFAGKMAETGIALSQGKPLPPRSIPFASRFWGRTEDRGQNTQLSPKNDDRRLRELELELLRRGQGVVK